MANKALEDMKYLATRLVPDLADFLASIAKGDPAQDYFDEYDIDALKNSLDALSNFYETTGIGAATVTSGCKVEGNMLINYTNEDWANDVIDKFDMITGRPVTDVYTMFYGEPDADAPMFDNEVVEETYDSIREYLLGRGVELGRIDDIWYAIDDALTYRRPEFE